MNILRNNLKNGYNDIVITHGDADGMGAAAFAEMYSTHHGRGVIVVGHMDPTVTKTDELVKGVVEMMDSVNEIHTVFILDRALCSENIIVNLKEVGIESICYIDHHITNIVVAETLEDKYPEFIVMITNPKYSATWLTYETLVTDTAGIDSFEAMATAILIDAWDTFKWSRCITEDDKDGSKFILDDYKIDLSVVPDRVRDMLLPLDVKAVDLNYAVKFEDIEFMYDALHTSILKQRSISGYETVIAKYHREQVKLLKDLKSEWEFSKDFENSKCENYYTRVVPQENNKEFVVSIFVADTVLPSTVSGIVAHYFLKENPGTILIMKSSKETDTFSCRSTGNVSALPIAQLFGGGGHPKACGFKIVSVDDELNYSAKDKRTYIGIKLEDEAKVEQEFPVEMETV